MACGGIRMTFRRQHHKGKKAVLPVMAGLLLGALLTGCGGKEGQGELAQVGTEKTTGIANETAGDSRVDFGVLKSENPDIFAWLYLPGTGIDHPVLQSGEADDYYESHDAFGQENGKGALYTELANLTNMCDFNTVIHGKTEGGSPFEKLYQFTDPDFFEGHREMYVFIEGNMLTYEVFAAFEREDTSLIRTYDFTYLEGCRQFLKDIYNSREMGKQVREGWEGVTPYNFLVTLTAQSPAGDGRQLVVIGVLTGDAAGTIDRLINE